MPAGPVMLRTAVPEDLPEIGRTLDAGTLEALGWTSAWDAAWWDGMPAARAGGRVRRWFGSDKPEVSLAAAHNPVSERFIVLGPGGRSVIGGIDMARVSAPRTVRVSFWLVASARGRGRMVHALDALGRLAAGHLGVDRITASSNRVNPAAQAVLRKAGFSGDAATAPWQMTRQLDRPAAPDLCPRIDALRPVLGSWLEGS